MDIESRIQTALDAYKHDNSQKITVLARQNSVPYQRLLRRIHGTPSAHAKKPVNYMLNKEQEEAVKLWIYDLDKAGQAPTAQRVRDCANSILKRNHTDPSSPPPQVSKMWSYRFIKRLPQGFRRLKQKPLEKKRLESEDIGIMQTWFDRFEIIMKKHQIQPQDLYNFDEIGFQEGQGRAESVITQKPDLNGYIGANYSRSLITVIECVAADGSILPPCIILPGKGHLEDWFTHSNMPDSWLISVSSTGYTSDEIAFNWVQHFDIYSKKRQVDTIPIPFSFSIFMA